MACGSCGILSFGKRRRRAAKKAEKEDKVTRRKSRRSRRSKRSRSRQTRKNRSRSRRRRSRRSFGIVAGPGYKGQTSYSNAYAPYFGSAENFINASNWWYPYAGGVAQSPQMLYKKPWNNIGPGN